MNGLDSESDPRLYQNLEYVETLITEWTKLFRKSADTTVPVYSNTPGNNTPDTSLNAAGTDHVDSAANADYSISLPFAAHEIFIKIIGMMKYLDLVPLLLRILYGILPFLKLHIEFVVHKLKRESDGLSASFSENLIMYYFCHVSDAFGSFEKIDSSDSYLLQIREELLYFAVCTFTCLSPMLQVCIACIILGCARNDTDCNGSTCRYIISSFFSRLFFGIHNEERRCRIYPRMLLVLHDTLSAMDTARIVQASSSLLHGF
jgi:hypothetical protein